MNKQNITEVISDSGNRPILDKKLDNETFRNYYYLKEELIAFCKQEDLQTTGGKIELTDRIAYYLETGERLSAKMKPKIVSNIGLITEDCLIENNFICSEKHRAFFEQAIGSGFSFNVLFQKWLKTNYGKTYGEAIKAYHQILTNKKKGSTKIDKQFEYNTYIRDFFADNIGKSLDEAIRCWKHKKSQQGHNRYEKADLDTYN